MTATFIEACDSIFSLLNTKWQAETGSIAGYIPTVYWPGANEPSEKSAVYWARVSIQNVAEQQTTLADADSTRRFTARGLLTVQLFGPINVINSWRVTSELASVAHNAFRDARLNNGVWFRRVVSREVAKERAFYRYNVIAQYSYDEAR